MRSALVAVALLAGCSSTEPAASVVSGPATATSAAPTLTAPTTAVAGTVGNSDLGVAGTDVLEDIAAAMQRLDGTDRPIIELPVNDGVHALALGDPTEPAAAGIVASTTGTLISIELAASMPPTPVELAALSSVLTSIGHESSLASRVAATEDGSVIDGPLAACRRDETVLLIPATFGCDE